MSMMKVENEPNLVRDPHSKAIINTDSSGYAAYIANRDRLSKQQEEITSLKQDVSDIKTILMSLLEKINTVSTEKK